MYSIDLINFVEDLKNNFNPIKPEKRISSFSGFYLLFKDFLKKENINFKYQRKNSIKSGSANIKINLENFKIEKTLFLVEEEDEFIKMNIFIHELTHFILDHNNLNKKISILKNEEYKDTRQKITLKQKEFVADSVAELFVLKITGKELNEYANKTIHTNEKSIVNYRKNFISDAKINKNQFNEIKSQIIFSLKYLFKNINFY